ncbi:MAG: MGMT family protein [Bacteroidota bacterium]|nr:MGMT family protein [Bacteroidota bacterium]
MSDSFFQQVYEVVKKIPYGKVTSYGAIARYLGTGQSARVIGWAMNSSFSEEEFVPAHRVVNREGVLTGKLHFGTTGIMAQLLINEGIKVEDDRIVDFESCFWDPNKEL